MHHARSFGGGFLRLLLRPAKMFHPRRYTAAAPFILFNSKLLGNWLCIRFTKKNGELQGGSSTCCSTVPVSAVLAVFMDRQNM